ANLHIQIGPAPRCGQRDFNCNAEIQPVCDLRATAVAGDSRYGAGYRPPRRCWLRGRQRNKSRPANMGGGGGAVQDATVTLRRGIYMETPPMLRVLVRSLLAFVPALLAATTAFAHDNWVNRGAFKNGAGEWC